MSVAAASVRAGRPVTGADEAGSWLGWLVEVTALTAAAELLVLRLFTRTIIHIPGAQDAAGPLSLVAWAGRYAYWLAVLALVATLAVLVRELGARRCVIATTAVVVFLVSAAGARAGAVGDAALALAVCLSVLLLATAAWPALAGPGRVVLSAFTAAFVVSAVYALAQSGAIIAAPTSGRTAPLLVTAEGLVLAGGALTPSLVPKAGDRRAAFVGGLAGIAVFGALAASASTTKILLLWNLGLAGYFPAPIYGVVAGTIVYTGIALARAGRHRSAFALALVVIGGIGLHSTYQSGLVIAGLALLGPLDAALPSGRGALSPAARPPTSGG